MEAKRTKRSRGLRDNDMSTKEQGQKQAAQSARKQQEGKRAVGAVVEGGL